MRLFFINMHRHWGGQSAVVVLLAGELAKRGHEVLVAGVANSELIKRATAEGLKTYAELELRRGFRPISFFGDHGRLKKLWSDFKPDIILTNGSQDTWSCAFARLRFRDKPALVRWRHNSFEISTHAANRWLYRKLISHVVVSSSEIAPLLTKTGLVSAERITPFPPSTRLEKFLNAQATSGLRKEFNVAPEGTLTVSVGRLAPEKGHDVLIRAWKRVHAELPHAKLLIAGLGTQHEPLAKLTRDLGLDAHVFLPGFREDIPALYAEADLAVLAPTAGESFGIALLEAYATGRACVATDVGGVKDLVVNGETGWLVPPKDDEKLAAALIEALKNPEARAKFGAAGKARVLEKFTPAKLADTAEALFKKLAPARG